MKPLVILLISLLPAIGYAQSNKSRIILGKAQAQKRLEETLTDSTLHNALTQRTEVIADSSTAVAVAEPILFSIYGRKEIREQRPYEIYKIKNYWVISGTLPAGWVGGTFLIITNAHDGKILRITHGK